MALLHTFLVLLDERAGEVGVVGCVIVGDPLARLEDVAAPGHSGPGGWGKVRWRGRRDIHGTVRHRRRPPLASVVLSAAVVAAANPDRAPSGWTVVVGAGIRGARTCGRGRWQFRELLSFKQREVFTIVNLFIAMLSL